MNHQVSTETTFEVEPHITEDTNKLLLGVSLLVKLLALQVAVAELTVVTPEWFQPLEPSLRLSPSASELNLPGGFRPRTGGRRFLE